MMDMIILFIQDILNEIVDLVNNNLNLNIVNKVRINNKIDNNKFDINKIQIIDE
jgi:tRNA G26 N,N-dimethylase Trm1